MKFVNYGFCAGGGVAPRAGTRTTTQLFAFLLTLLPFFLSAQTRSTTPLTQNSKPATQNSTRAVVVGISNYQDDGIPDLRFADRDAEAFVAWLRSPAGGSVPERNLVMLTNEQATLGKISMALTGLITDTREGDQVIIYFSGHGDVENTLITQPGYLLCNDSKSTVYIAGAFSLSNLQLIVSTLTVQNKARVLLITDACRAGKLAGSAINGAQLTNANLANQFENATKILSCEPNEFSLEGAEWGGGRGLFSYHLVDGLTGLADADHDGLVITREIQRYLQDKVTTEAEPAHQNPMVVGSATERIATVDVPTLDILKQERSGRQLQLTGTDMRGWEDDIVATTDSATQAVYFAYKNALKHGALLDTADGFVSAWALLPQLLQRENLRDLHGLLRRNLAAALIDDAQQALNAILSDDPFEINAWTLNPAKYKLYPLYLQRALELIGESNYLYRSLMAKKRYFEGYNVYFNAGANQDSPAVRDSFRQEAKKIFLDCLEYEPGAAYACYSIGSLVIKMGDYAQAEKNLVWLKKAVELAPNWKQPYVNIGEVYLNWLAELDSAETWLMRAYALDSISYLLLQEISWLRQWQHRPEDANAICRKLIAMRPDLPNAYFTMGHTLFFLQGKVEEAAQFMQKGKELDAKTALNLNTSESPVCHAQLMLKNRRQQEAIKCLETALQREDLSNDSKSFLQMLLAEVYAELRDVDRAAEYIQKAEEISDSSAWIISETAKGRMQLLQGRLDEAEKTLLYVLTIDKTTNDWWVRQWALLGCVKAAQNRPAEAEAYFKKATSFFGGNAVNYYWEEAWFLYGQFLLAQNRDADALHAFEKTEEVYPNGYYAPYGMALFEAKKGHKTVALDWLERALDRYYPIPQPILKEPLFSKLRKTQRFKTLLAKHFPETTKH